MIWRVCALFVCWKQREGGGINLEVYIRGGSLPYCILPSYYPSVHEADEHGQDDHGIIEVRETRISDRELMRYWNGASRPRRD